MLESIQTFQRESHSFLKKISQNLVQQNFKFAFQEIDHICYRTSSLENYQEAKEFFSKIGDLLTEEEVRGRPIATYKLFNPIEFDSFIIDLVEVPAPKANKVTKEGLEHIEIVVNQKLDSIIALHPEINFVTSGLSKEFNPELEIEFSDCAVKFHHKSLEHVINVEKNKTVNDFLSQSKILHLLKDYSPCLSGTIPLEINLPTSDLDILCQAEDLDGFFNIMKNNFSSYPQFTSTVATAQGQKSLITSFKFKELTIEVFCQNICPFSQQANIHFLVEGRLLKLGGQTLKKNILKLKKEGIKTEPAFGQILDLKNPYEDLLALHRYSDLELKKFLKQRMINE